MNGEAEWEETVVELMKEVDRYVPTPERDTEKPFLMPVEDVFSITGRGTVATGRIERGIVRTGEKVEIVGIREEKTGTTVTGVEMFRKILDEGQAGDNVGLVASRDCEGRGGAWAGDRASGFDYAAPEF